MNKEEINSEETKKYQSIKTGYINEISNILDARTALTGLYLWLLFGYLSSMVNCDLQKLMTENMYFRHIVGIIAFFFLFTVIDKDNKLHIIDIWKKTIFIYAIFLLMIKSKWYFSLPVLSILVVDQTIKTHIEYLTNLNENDKNIQEFEKTRSLFYKLMIVIIIIGFIHYSVRQYNEFGKDFSLVKLLLSSKCKN
jgi:hypothetical protein